MDKLFLDANVLFSAAYSPDSSLVQLFTLPDVELVTSRYALEEALRNLSTSRPWRVATLHEMTGGLVITEQAGEGGPIPEDVVVADKDLPILASAIACGCTHLLTGDRRHFRRMFGTAILGVMIVGPSEYLRGRNRP